MSGLTLRANAVGATVRSGDASRLLLVALDLLEQSARDGSIGFSTGHYAFLAGSADIRPDRFSDYSARDAYVAQLLTDIRASLGGN